MSRYSKWVAAGTIVIVAIVATLAIVAGQAEPPRLVAEDPTTGFALYRSGRLSPADLNVLCDLGVREIAILDGQGEERERLFRQTVCPDLRIRYDFTQEEDRPVSLDFLKAFDAWIEEARANGRKIAFRCRYGWHRTGRLAAYYRIRFEGVPAAEAMREMHEIGHMMWRHPTLDAQVLAYADLVAGRPYTVELAHCPSSVPDGGLWQGRFPEDVYSEIGPNGMGRMSQD